MQSYKFNENYANVYKDNLLSSARFHRSIFNKFDIRGSKATDIA